MENEKILKEVTSPDESRRWWPAVFLLLIQAFITAALIQNPDTQSWLLWYCNHIALLFAAALLTRRPQMAMGLMHVGLLVQFTWMLDFFGHFFGLNFVNEADYMFDGNLDALKIGAFVSHIIVPIAMLVWTYKTRPRPISFVYATVYFLALYSLTLTFSQPSENINCVFEPCTTLMSDWNYTLLWPAYVGLLVIITYFVQLYFFTPPRERIGSH